MDITAASQWVRTVVSHPVFELSGTQVVVGHLLTAAALLLVTRIAAGIARRAFERVLDREDLKDPGTLRAGQRLTHFVIYMVGTRRFGLRTP